MLSPIQRTSVPDAVFEQLVSGIVGGDFAVGVALPGERQLAERLGVSRPAVREAMQRLSQAGLVRVRQGEGTTVRDYRDTAGPDLLPRLLMRAGPDGAPELDLHVARSIVEVRLAIGPDIARLAARRRNDSHVKALATCLDDFESQQGNAVALQHTALAWWSSAVDASDNVAYRLLYNSLRAAYTPIIDTLAVVLSAEVTRLDDYRTITDAITRQQPAVAETAARELLTAGTSAVLALLDDLAPDDAEPVDLANQEGNQ